MSCWVLFWQLLYAYLVVPSQHYVYCTQAKASTLLYCQDDRQKVLLKYIVHLKHIKYNLCCFAPEFSSKLISKSAKIPGIGMTSLTLLSMHVIWKGKGNVLPISIILADLEINLDENSGVKQHKLYYMCFRNSKTFQISCVREVSEIWSAWTHWKCHSQKSGKINLSVFDKSWEDKDWKLSSLCLSKRNCLSESK